MEVDFLLIGQLLTILAISSVAYFWFFVVRTRYTYWSKLGIDGPKPSLFRMGNMTDKLVCQSTKLELDWQLRYGKLYGHYSTLEPVLTIADPELIKQIMVKDFVYFVNRRSTSNFSHSLWTSSLFLLNDHHWKRVRSITSSAFSSGKLHSIIPLVDCSVQKLIKNLDQMCVANGDQLEIETRNLITGFAIDVIASTSFGIETSANNVSADSQMNAILVNGTNFNNATSLQLFGLSLFPGWLNRLLNNQHFFNRDSFNYFRQLMKQVIDQRKHNGNAIRKRKDFVQLMLDARVEEDQLETTGFEQLTAVADEQPQQQGSIRPSSDHKPSNKLLRLSDDEIMAQGIAFFVAGFDTTSATINYCLYELSFNQDIQQRLFDELDKIFEDATDDDNVEQQQNIHNRIINNPYLDAVIKETLRKYPPGVRTERRVEIDGYRLANVPLSKGQLIEVSIYGVHHNPEYFPEPNRFDPERFMPENRDRLVPYSYLPFGVGPRNCIGMRFAYLEVKLLLARLLHKFQFTATEQTPIPIKYDVNAFVLSAKPFPVLITRRHHQ